MAATAAEGGRHAQAEERARVPTEGEPDGVRRLAHTADTGIAVTAPTFDVCLARAAARLEPRGCSKADHPGKRARPTRN
jgi:hypothetical protein